MKRLLLALAVCAGLLSPAGAFTGNSVWNWCTTGRQSRYYISNTGWCLGYISGAASTMTLYGHVCIPKGVTWGQVKGVVVKYLRDRPQARHLPAAALVGAAIQEAGWSCKKK